MFVEDKRNWLALRDAIVVESCRSYHRSLKRLKRIISMDNFNDNDKAYIMTVREIKNIESFIRSEWFELLTNTDGRTSSRNGNGGMYLDNFNRSLHPDYLLKHIQIDALGDMDYDELFKNTLKGGRNE